ncbi:MAG: hypothetical protein ACXWDO_04940 [Bacteroidia bacterium]
MKKLFVLLLVQLLVTAGGKAQYQDIDPKYVSQVRGKILLVALQEETTRTLLDLKSRPDELQKYKDGIANFNKILEETAKKYWTYGTKGVETMPQSEVNKLMKEGNAKYAVLQYSLREGRLNPLMFKDIYGRGEYGNEERALSKKEGYGVFHLQIAQRDKEPTNVYSVFLPVAYPSQADMIYAVQMMNTQFNTMQKKKDYKLNEFEAEITANNKLLKKKTLLIDPSQLSSKTTVEDIKKGYPNAVEVADYATINETVINGNGAYAYVMITPIEMPGGKITQSKVKTMLMHLVVDAEDGKVLGKAKPSRLDYDKIADDITRKEAKEYIAD